jgi:hypothetical protein
VSKNYIHIYGWYYIGYTRFVQKEYVKQSAVSGMTCLIDFKFDDEWHENMVALLKREDTEAFNRDNDASDFVIHGWSLVATEDDE